MTITDRTGNIPQGLGIKAPCTVATTTNITLSGLQTIDGVTVTANQRVLVKEQTLATQNGIYQASTGNWTRPADASGDESWIAGTLVYIASGTINSGSFQALTTTSDPVVIDTDNLTFTNTNVITSTPWTTTSTTSNAIAQGMKTFTVGAGKLFQAGDLVKAQKTSDSGFYMFGPVSSYSGTTLILDVRDTMGSGTITSWDIRATAPSIVTNFNNKLNYVFRRTWWHWNGR